MALRDRIAARRSGALGAREWQRIDEAWFATANGRYKACVARRPLPADAPPIRLGVKDTIDVGGLPTALGLRHHMHHPTSSAAVLTGMDPGLAAVVAKVVTMELNLGLGTGCVNPYFPEIDPGGSSTGAAVAVAAGICDVALGTDVLGSVRWPAGQCGTVGLRSTYNGDALDGVFPLSPQMDALGWVARTAGDLATAADVLSPRLGAAPAPPSGEPLTVGIVGPALAASSAEMSGAVRAASDIFSLMGHRVREVDLGELWTMRGLAWQLCSRQAWDAYQIWRDWVDVELKDSTLAALHAGSAVDDDVYQQATEQLERCRAGILDLFSKTAADIWLMPLDPNPPPTVEETRARASTIPVADDKGYTDRVGFTPIASWAGLPSLTIPVQRHPDTGGPLCVQFSGRPGTDLALISLACEFERLRPDLDFTLS